MRVPVQDPPEKTCDSCRRRRHAAEAPGHLGVDAEARILWDKLADALEAVPADPRRLRGLQRFVLNGEAPFGALLGKLRERALAKAAGAAPFSGISSSSRLEEA